MAAWIRYTASALGGALVVLATVLIAFADVRHDATEARSDAETNELRIEELERWRAMEDQRFRGLLKTVERMDTKLDKLLEK